MHGPEVYLTNVAYIMWTPRFSLRLRYQSQWHYHWNGFVFC